MARMGTLPSPNREEASGRAQAHQSPMERLELRHLSGRAPRRRGPACQLSRGLDRRQARRRHRLEGADGMGGASRPALPNQKPRRGQKPRREKKLRRQMS